VSLVSAPRDDWESIEATLIGRSIDFCSTLDPHEVPSQSTTPDSMASTRPAFGLRIPEDDRRAAAAAAAADAVGDPMELFQSRLQAASIISLACLLVFYGRAMFLDVPMISLMRSVSLVICVGCLGMLASPGVLSTRKLRRIELLLFGPLCAFVVFFQIAFLIRAIEAGDVPQQIAVFYSGTLGLAVIMLAYGMLMPHGWKRTALMMIPPVTAPTVAMFVVWCVAPKITEVIDAMRLVEIGLALIVTGIVATYGTYASTSLRCKSHPTDHVGQYRLKQELGRGGMGNVFLAEHKLLKRPCAIKVIRTTHGADPSALRRFEREVRSTARLSHWNTIEIFDYGHTDDGTFFYVMEYLRGSSLSDLVEKFGPMPPARAIHFLSQTCWALREAHNLGLIHRDLKPANIFAAKRGGVYDVTKLFDFGLVLQRNESNNFHDPHAETPFAGSPLYMSPEQAAGQKLDGRTDIYSLGGVGYFLLTGRPPFERKSTWRLMLAHAKDELLPPSHWNSEIPKDLESVLLRCLSKDSEQRFNTPSEMAQSLAGCHDAGRWRYENAAEWWKRHAVEIDPTLLQG